MYYISYEDQLRIKRRIKRLPQFMKREEIKILVFETISTLILAYGVCISIFKHPIKDKIPDPACDIFITCFYYFGLSVSVPFTGGHMNPSTTIAFNFLKKNNHMHVYFVAQLLGATIASLSVPAPYVEQSDFWSCVLDTIGEAVGLFIVIFVALLVTQTRYASSEYFGYMVISFSVMAGRAYLLLQTRFTFRKGCINPALGTVFQVVYAIWNQQYILIVYSLPVIIGPTVGAIAAYFLFMKFYKQLIEEVKQANELRQAMQQP